MKKLFAALLVLHAGLAGAQAAYTLKEESAGTGSRIRRDVVKRASYPLDKPYEAFTADERLALKQAYEPMPESDEPPFPRDGMRAFVREVVDAAGKRRARGLLVLVALVNKDGSVEKVDIYASPDPQLSRYAAIMLGKTPFKPARCGGQPCVMEFPYAAQIDLE